ncbi:MAG: hypothetical protein ACI4PO_04155 [Faecousia sp.]
MSKYLRKKKKKSVLWIPITIAVVLVLAVVAVFAMPQMLYSMSDEAYAEDPNPELSTAPEETAETVPTLSFPLLLEDGRLEVGSLFQFSGINPDCGNREGTDIAAMELKNTSGQYLAEAKITLTLPDGTQLNFTVTELPAGASVMAFSTENLSIPTDAACVSADCQASFDPAAVTASDQVTAAVDGIHVTLTNISGQDISQIVVYCRGILGEEYFGGVTYSYTVTNLPAGESITVDATDCILGMAEVVRLAIN